MKYFKNPYFQGLLLAITFTWMAVEVFVFGRSFDNMTIVGNVCKWIFLVDIVAWAFYVVILKALFQVKW